MRNRNRISSLMLAFAILACNLPAGVTPTPTSALPSATVVSSTPEPTASPLSTPTGTPAVPIAWPRDVPVNCRFGPGTVWETIGALPVNQTATILGRNSASTWWYVQTPNDPGTPCWVAASVTNTAGNLAGLSVTPAPTASVTNISVEVDPEDINLPGCIGPVEPVEITGAIQVNGPLTVKYHFETEQGGAMSTQTIEFDSFGSETVEVDFSPDLEEGNFWIRLVLTQPDDQEAETEYEMDCSP